MNKILKLLCISLTALTIVNGADAQRSREFRPNGNNNTNSRGDYSSTRSAPVRTFNNNDRSVTYRSEERSSIRKISPDNRVTETRRYNSGYPSSRNVSRTSTYRGSSNSI